MSYPEHINTLFAEIDIPFPPRATTAGLNTLFGIESPLEEFIVAEFIGNDEESGTAFQFPAPPETLTPASTSFASEAG
jgi:hypothetical protein